jgi:hypothetical protein
MSEPVALISSEEIQLNDFLDFLEGQGAVLTPEDPFNGYIARDQACIWLALCLNECKQEFDPNDPVLLKRLQSTPRTWVIVEISRQPHSKRLAIEFALNFGERWNAIMDNLRGKLYSRQELNVMLNQGTLSPLY